MEYYESRNNLPWAQDQFLMSQTFLTNQDRSFLETNFLDCPIDDQKRKSVFLHKTMPVDFSPNTTNIQENIFQLIEDHNVCSWAGEPCDTRGSFIRSLLNFDNEYCADVMKTFEHNTLLREFYGVEL